MSFSALLTMLSAFPYYSIPSSFLFAGGGPSPRSLKRSASGPCDPCKAYTGKTQEISEKAKESQKHNEHVHYLGPSGYASKRIKWCIDDPIASLNDPDCSNLSLLSTERTERGFDWLGARARADGQGGHYFPNKKIKDVCLTMNELHNPASEGSWTPQGHDDLLTCVLGNKEHGGRVRGVGGGVKMKDVFKSGPRRHSGLVSTDELATITEEIRKKVQKECEEIMNSKLEGIFNQLKQMGVSLEADQFVNDVGA
ncbi:hypothetical protein AgCh_039993 [Apium graveolens]